MILGQVRLIGPLPFEDEDGEGVGTDDMRSRKMDWSGEARVYLSTPSFQMRLLRPRRRWRCRIFQPVL
jgi:hypothetical protein